LAIMRAMTPAEFEALATAALEASEDKASSSAQDLQHTRATLACLRLQAGHLDQVMWFLAELATDASTPAERAGWCELGERVLDALTTSVTST
jgi:hypothetical protein